MRYFRVKRFSGIQSQREGTDQDRGSLVLCENALPYPDGSLRSTPRWTPLYEDHTISGGYQSLEDANGHHLLVTVDPDSNIANGIAWFSNTASADLNPADTISSVVETGLDTTFSGRPYISRIGADVFIGDGVSDNMVYGASSNWIVSTFASVSDYYAQADTVFPPATSFVVGPDKSVYASGNVAEPTTVWVSEPATLVNPNHANSVQGVYSGVLSNVVLMLNEATKVTALSTFRNYVVCHTDRGVVVLYRTEKNQAGTGYRVEQASSPTTAGASNPYCVSPAMGVQPYYLGTDGQIYKDEAVRASIEHRVEGRKDEIVTWKAVGTWDSGFPVDQAFTVFEPESGFYMPFVPTRNGDYDATDGYEHFMFSQETSQLAGPFSNPLLTCVTRVEGTSRLIGVDRYNKFWTAEMSELRERRTLFDLPELPAPVSDAYRNPTVYLSYNNEVPPILDSGNNTPLLDGDGDAILLGEPMLNLVYKRNDDEAPDSLTWLRPFDNPYTTDEIETDSMTAYEGSYLSIIETAFEDMATPEMIKHFMELMLKMQTASKGHMGVYFQTENGRMTGRWYGDVEAKDAHKIFYALRGKQLRIRVYIITKLEQTWVIKDFASGYILQNTL
jgi:hypothetical protein